ncbi:SCO2583/SCO2584 N-terminal domain-containing protein [Saccharothrix sp. ST-888]|uniref:SCO2583/SCO2584 N-terminal domain-containing protein n=1 Tax=Saccharothrix sp. ST-888 TaxID=1427391 RepID=UPI0005EC9DDE|nr:hypothetical protein [Saccharothrix sp. ST-888]KJK56281.1 hypothetical protein UK12_23625 [Saccharothrix sp. ST-888]
MPTAEDPHPRPGDEPAGDPFENLVLDEEFVRSATVKEQSGRARMLAAKWQREPPEPVRPQTPARRRAGGVGRLQGRVGRRWQSWLIVALVIGLVLLSLQLATGGRPSPTPPVIQQTQTPLAPPASPAPTPGTDSPVARPVGWTP